MKYNTTHFSLLVVDHSSLEQIIDGIQSHYVTELISENKYEEVYYDTEDQLLNRCGFGFFYKKGEHFNTFNLTYGALKSDAGNDKLWILSDTDKLPLDKLKKTSGLNLPEPPKKIFRLQIHESVLSVKFVLLKGEIIFRDNVVLLPKTDKTKSQSLRFKTLDIRMKQGDPFIFQKMINDLYEKTELKPFETNRRIHALNLTGLNRMKIDYPELTANMQISTAIQKLSTYYIRSAILMKSGTELGMDPEYNHDFRVNLRKLRSILSFFSSIFKKDGYETLNMYLRWLFQLLGHKRDADIYGEVLERYLPSDLDKDLKRFIDKQLRRFISDEKHHLQSGFDSAQFQQFIKISEKLIDSELFDVHSSLMKSTLNDFVLDSMHKYIDEIRTLSKLVLKHWKLLSKTEVHNIRKKLKKLRYLISDFISLAPEDPAFNIEILKNCQDKLGYYMDLITFDELTNRFLSYQNNELLSEKIAIIMEDIHIKVREQQSHALKDVKTAVIDWLKSSKK